MLPLSAGMLNRTKVGMGTFITLSLDETQKHHFQNGFKILKDVELSLSSYDKNSPVSRLNKNKYVKLDKYTFEAFSLSHKYYKRSDGYFDITVGSVTKDLYRFGEDERVPSKEELQNSHVSFKALRFNESEAFLEKDSKVDLGGMGKGFGVDKVAKYLKKHSIKQAEIALSGDIRCLGVCDIQIQSPFHDGIFASFKTIHNETAISTSGNYNRYVDTKKNNHLINPKIKQSQDKFISITLVSKMSNSDLDAYATAASVMPIDKAYAFLDSLDLAYLVIQSDEEFRFSDNLYYYLSDLLIHNATKK